MTESRLDVAIIDDDDGVRESLMLLFEISDINAVAFASAEAFLASTAPRARCLIVDQIMPGICGLDLIARLRAAGDEVPVLLLSGMVTRAMEQTAGDLGGIQVMRKPPGPRELIAFVASFR